MPEGTTFIKDPARWHGIECEISTLAPSLTNAQQEVDRSASISFSRKYRRCIDANPVSGNEFVYTVRKKGGLPTLISKGTKISSFASDGDVCKKLFCIIPRDTTSLTFGLSANLRHVWSKEL